jgi:hypothetical protein
MEVGTRGLLPLMLWSTSLFCRNIETYVRSVLLRFTAYMTEVRGYCAVSSIDKCIPSISLCSY